MCIKMNITLPYNRKDLSDLKKKLLNVQRNKIAVTAQTFHYLFTDKEKPATTR